MSSLLRLTLAAALSGLLAAALLLPFSAAAPQQQKAAQPPAVKKAAADQGKKENDFTDALTLPTKREAKKRIDAADDYIKAEAWPETCQLLQSLLEEPEDVFVQVKRIDPPGQESLVWTSVRAEANRLIGRLPAQGLETYEVLYGARAREQLVQARAKGDVHQLAETALKYFHTEAGAEATNLLGTYHLDRGRYMMAALCLERLVQRLPPNKVPALTLFKAYLAHRQMGDTAMAEHMWKLLNARAGREGLRLGDQVVHLDQLRKELDRKPAAEPPDSHAAALFRYNPSRTGQALGSVPYLKRRWEYSMLPLENMRAHVQTKEKITQAIGMAERYGNALPGFFPIAANGRLVFRTYWGLFAVHLATGDLAWHTDMKGSLESVLASNLRMSIEPWMGAYANGNQLHHVLLENSTVGTLSTDLSRVYAVDDLAVPPHPQYTQQVNPGGGGAFYNSPALSELVDRSLLRAYDLDNGKLMWEVGGDRGPKELLNCHFLGAPLPLGGKLYVLLEHNGELRLVCLDPPRDEKSPPAILWMQTLATVQVKLAQDPGRRIQAANLSYGDGILICPTNAGAVLGVDLLAHSLVWAYPYREGQATEMMGTRQFNRTLPVLPVKAPEWKASAPIVQDGRVYFTAPDASSIHCLRLRDGTRQWRIPRGDDLYLAGVFKDKVLLVGKTHCRALKADTGEPIWTLEVGQPAGQGVGSGTHYYLPVKRPVPGVVKIDLDKGQILSHSRCREDDALGNLVYYAGDVYTQNEQWVRAYPQLEAEIARLDRELAANPTHPARLAERGELRLDHGNLKGAIADLSLALSSNPPEALVPKTRDKLFDTLTELLQRDFTGAEPYLKQYEQLCAIVVPDNADAKVRGAAKERERMRRATYWCLLAKGREEQGRLNEAFKAYLEYGGLAGPGELLPVVGQPGVRARPDVWAQGRIAGLLDKAEPGQRATLEAEIDRRWETVRAGADTGTLRSFVNTFGSFSAAAGREGRLQLAERLLKANDFLEAEMQLLQLRDQTADPGASARAVEGLARLMLGKTAKDRTLFHDAAWFYRQLGRSYLSASLTPGRKGIDAYNDAAAHPLILPYLDEPAATFPSGRLKYKEVPGSFAVPQGQMIYAMEPRGEALPFHQRFRIGISTQNYHLLRILDRESGEELWSQMLERTSTNYLFSNPTTRSPVYLNGHMAVLYLGHMVYALDLVEKKELWRKSLLGNEPYNAQWQIFQDGEGLTATIPSSGTVERLGGIVAVTPGYVCLLTREGLVGLEPATGSILWTKSDVHPRTLVFGDEEYLYLVDAREGGSGTARVVRGKDGSAVDVPDFAAQFKNKPLPRSFGRHLLVTENREKEAILRLYDIRTGKDLWRKVFTPNSVTIRTELPEVTGVIEPNGAVTLINLRTGQLVFHPEMFRPEFAGTLGNNPLANFPASVPWGALQRSTATSKPAHVMASHMQQGIQDALLLQDADQYYLVLNTIAPPANNQVARGNGPWPNVQGGLRYTQISGVVYAFQRHRGLLNWYREVPTQMLLLDRFEEIPILLFTARINKQLNQGGNAQTSATMSIDKRTGKLLYERDTFANSMFHALKVDRRLGTVDLVSHNMTVRHYLEGMEAVEVGPGKPAGQPARPPLPEPKAGLLPRAGAVVPVKEK